MNGIVQEKKPLTKKFKLNVLYCLRIVLNSNSMQINSNPILNVNNLGSKRDEILKEKRGV